MKFQLVGSQFTSNNLRERFPSSDVVRGEVGAVLHCVSIADSLEQLQEHLLDLLSFLLGRTLHVAGVPVKHHLGLHLRPQNFPGHSAV